MMYYVPEIVYISANSADSNVVSLIVCQSTHLRVSRMKRAFSLLERDVMYVRPKRNHPYATMVPVYTIYINFVFQSELTQSELTEEEIICEYILVNNWTISSNNIDD